MKTTLFFLLSFLLLCSSKCKEDPLPEPNPNPTTETPTDEISCLINGVEWKTGPPFLLSNPNTEVVIQKKGEEYEIGITAKKRDNNGKGRFFSFGGNYNYPLIRTLKIEDAFYTENITVGKDYQIDKLFKNEIKITKIDTLKKYIKGEFNFNGLRATDTVKITNGKFNCNYQFIK